MFREVFEQVAKDRKELDEEKMGRRKGNDRKVLFLMGQRLS